MKNLRVSLKREFSTRFCALLLILGFPEPGNTFWPAAYRVDLNDRKTFVLSTGEEGEEGEEEEEEDDDDENEMIRPEDVAMVDLRNDEQRYEPLHSHVEHYNRRAVQAATKYSSFVPQTLSRIQESEFFDEGKPYVAGFKRELDKVKRSNAMQKKRSLEKWRGTMRTRGRAKRQEEDILNLENKTGNDLVESMNARNHTSEEEEEEEDERETSVPNTKNTTSTTKRSEGYEEYGDETSNISGESATPREIKSFERNETNEKAGNKFLDDESMTDSSESDKSKGEIYDYESLRSEWDRRIAESKKGNESFNYTDKGITEEGPVDSLKKIVQFNRPRNCSAQELTKFGLKTFECLVFDYKNAKNRTDVKKIASRTWKVLRIWICVYACIALPAWCQKGWCCCCFRCDVCFPHRRIATAKYYYAKNEPGTLVDRPGKGATEPETIEYQPTIFEIDAYEQLESAIRNL